MKPRSSLGNFPCREKEGGLAILLQSLTIQAGLGTTQCSPPKICPPLSTPGASLCLTENKSTKHNPLDTFWFCSVLLKKEKEKEEKTSWPTGKFLSLLLSSQAEDAQGSREVWGGRCRGRRYGEGGRATGSEPLEGQGHPGDFMAVTTNGVGNRTQEAPHPLARGSSPLGTFSPLLHSFFPP